MRLEINIAKQTLKLFEGKQQIKDYLVSTAENGAGEINGSECTPRGRHVIRAKIGAGAPSNAVFVGRRLTGEVYSPELRKQSFAQGENRDWILTRILWLSGTEVGKNRLGRVDTMRRYIYIHGSPDEVTMGKPGSHGCIRMRNQDIIELFDLLKVGCEVLIQE